MQCNNYKIFFIAKCINCTEINNEIQAQNAVVQITELHASCLCVRTYLQTALILLTDLQVLQMLGLEY